MADKELTIKITGESGALVAKIGDLIKSFERLPPAAQKAESAFDILKIKSVADMEAISQSAKKAFAEIQNSGTATPKDIANAHTAMTKIIQENSQKQITIGNRVTEMWNKVKGAWVGILGAGVALNFLKNWVLQSIQAEEAAKKLEIQIKNLGISYGSVADSINVAVQATAKYATVQDEEVRRVLQQLIFITGDLQKAQENLNLVYDLAYLKGISASEAAILIGKALTGNVEMLGRYFPELRNVNESLGENATLSQKASVAIAFFAEKVKGATEEMTDHERKVLRLKKTWQDITQYLGGVTVFALDGLIKRIKGWTIHVLEAYSAGLWLTDALKITENQYKNMRIVISEAREELANYGKIVLDGTVVNQVASEQKELAITQVKELTRSIKEEGREAGLSGEQILTITKRISEVIEEQGDISKKTFKEQVEIFKKINVLRKEQVQQYKSSTEQQVKLTKELAEKSKKIEEEIVTARTANYEGALATLKDALAKGLTTYKAFALKVQGIEDEIRTNRETAAAALKELEDKRKLPKQVTKETAIGAQETLEKAQKAFDLGNFEEAGTLAIKARDAVIEVGKAAKSAGDVFVGTNVNIEAFAKKGIEEAAALAEKALTEQKRIASGGMENQKLVNTDIQIQITDLTDKINALIAEKKQIEFEILIAGYEDALAKKAELEKATSSMHTISVQQVQAQTEGGFVGAAAGRFFPGYGGGDKIPILGEAGEFMNRKEAVRFWGVDLFQSLNRIDPRAVAQSLGAQKFAEGGAISAPSVSQSPLDRVAVDLNLGNQTFNMQANKKTTNNFLEQIKKTNILRGRHSSPY